MDAEFKRMMELAGLTEISINKPSLLNQIKTLKNQIDSANNSKIVLPLAIRCAKLVLPIFEKEFPNDKRIRNVIEASEIYLADPTDKNWETLTKTSKLAANVIDEMDMSSGLRDEYYDSVYTAALTAVGTTTAILNDDIEYAQRAAYAAIIAAGGDPSNANELDEIKVNKPMRPLAIGQRYNKKHDIFDWDEIEITDIDDSSFGSKIIDVRSINHSDPRFGDDRYDMDEWNELVRNGDIIPL